MTSAEERSAPSGVVKAFNGLRTNSLAAIVMLLLEFGLGVGVNLYITVPAAVHGKALFPAFGSAVTGGPVILVMHAVLGTILLITGISAVIRASLVRHSVFIGITGVALLGIVVAWLSGARFVGTMANGASLTMALATGASLLCYALVLFIAPGSGPAKETP